VTETVYARGGGHPSGAERGRGVGVGADGGGVGTPPVSGTMIGI